jgi:hypothetical protein
MVFSGHANIEALPAQLKERVVEVRRRRTFKASEWLCPRFQFRFGLGGGPFAEAASERSEVSPPARMDRPRVRAHCWSFAALRMTVQVRILRCAQDDSRSFAALRTTGDSACEVTPRPLTSSRIATYLPNRMFVISDTKLSGHATAELVTGCR